MDRLYRRSGFASERERVEYLLGLHEKMMASLVARGRSGGNVREQTTALYSLHNNYDVFWHLLIWVVATHEELRRPQSTRTWRLYFNRNEVDNTLNEHRVSSPAATGSAGPFFEQHVAAYWLAQLLVQGRSPIIPDCSVTEVHLQTEHLGWHTDDFLIIGQDDAGNQRKLAGQVKRTFMISATNEECKKTITDFWQDFRNANEFAVGSDCFVLVTQRGTNTLLGDFRSLLQCARSARDDADFKHRLETAGLISKKAVRYCSELQKIIGDIEKRSITQADIWPFLCVLHVLSLDLCTSTSGIEAHIKSLLSHTIADSDIIGSTDTSWHELLELASQAMAEARGFQRSDLPDSLRQRHSVVGVSERKALHALKDHTELVLHGIRSTLGSSDFHLPRDSLVQQVLEKLESAQVILISGPAGSGKSAIAKDAINILDNNYFVFSFRAEEFAQPHLDTTLSNSQIPANSTALQAFLASQDRKILLIESVERLLEKSTRDAFSDLLTLAANDESLRIVLTCRNYSTDLVSVSFLAPARIKYSVIDIPPLDDAELTDVESSFPVLSQPLSDPALRQVLRNPYILDKALLIPWSSDQPLPQNEREFRAVFWRQVIRADDRLGEGMPRRREKIFQQIALRRAQALAAYVTCDNLDPAIIDRLRHDSLIASSDWSADLVAPAHDILEDWAILQWIETKYLTSNGSFLALSEAIGTHPAVRRTYRKWVAELIERDPNSADRLFNVACNNDVVVSAQFRDDTLISLLQAPSSSAFLERHVTVLLANDRYLLKRVIHLLRVACVTTPKWLSEIISHGSLINVPNGTAWASILKIVETHIETFTDIERPLLLGLIKDWARGVTWWTPYPDGAESVAAIAHWLLQGRNAYNTNRDETLRVIAKIPKADTTRFNALLCGSDEDTTQEYITDTFRDIVLSGLEGTPAARDVPDLVVSAASDYILCSEVDIQRDIYHGGSLDIERVFGVKKYLNRKYLPESAHRGPWLPLLRIHHNEGLDFVIKVFNHSADWYAHPRVHPQEREYIEPPFEIDLLFAGGTSQKQWGNSRLWCWYRGTSVGPNVLHSILMALEQWLLEFAESDPTELDVILLDILQRSNSAALTAVAASMATAFPHLSVETLLVFLRSPICIGLDLERKVKESSSSLVLLGRNGDNMIYNDERREANNLPHRKKYLEDAIRNIQLGPHANRVYEIIDQHRGALPPVSEQTDDERLWRLGMNRMDLRTYSISEVTTAEKDTPTDTASTEPIQYQIQMDPDELAPDLKDIVDTNDSIFNTINTGISLQMWGDSVFRKKDTDTYDPEKWQQCLDLARTQRNNDSGNEEIDLYRSGPGLVAAVCTRDRWQEMSDDERDWCVDTICEEVNRRADIWDDISRLQRFDLNADQPCARIISSLLGKQLNDIQKSQVRQAFAIALTHPNDEVRLNAAYGIGENLWPIDKELTLRCINLIAAKAALIENAITENKRLPFEQHRSVSDILSESAATIRHQFWTGDIANDAYQKLDITQGINAFANIEIIAIFSYVPSNTEAISAFQRTAKTLNVWWKSDSDYRQNYIGDRYDRDYRIDFTLSECIQNFVMKTQDDTKAEMILMPLLDTVDWDSGNNIGLFIRGLTSIEDRRPNTSRFWFIWDLFARRINCAPWLPRINEARYSNMGDGMLSAIFMISGWRENVRHWGSLEGHAHRVHTLFKDLPSSSVVLDAYVRFLYHIGEKSLPKAFIRITKYLRSGDVQRLLREKNTVLMLEVLLQRHVHGRPLELKRDTVIRNAVLDLLDILVEQGSPAAFRMRDDFVTPISGT